jgi:hypothetical protein
MKKIHFLFIALIAVLTACNVKENTQPDYPFKVTIKTLDDSTRVANVFVEILAQTGQGETKQLFKSWTNEKGESSFVYDKEAVLLIRATRGLKPNYTWIGCDFIFLQPNEEARRTVYIRPYDPEAEGC